MFFGIAAAAYLGIVGFMYLGQDGMIYFPEVPTRTVTANPSQVGLEFEELSLTTEDGESLHGWFVPAERARGSAIFFHGNAGNTGHRLDTLLILNELGLSTLIIDYRGFGQSTGEPGEDGTYQDALAAWDYLTRQRSVPAYQIVLVGRSLGSAVAAWLAAEKDPAGLVLESGFTSVPDLGAQLYPWLPVRLLSRYRYDTLDRLGHLEVPVLVAHSPQDEIIPYSHGRALFDAAPESSAFLEMSGSHGSGFLPHPC